MAESKALDDRDKLLGNMVDVYVLLFPVAALFGNALADSWLTLMALAFLASSQFKKNWQWLGQPWLLLAMVFWLWAIFCSMVSRWPADSLNDALTWIRFPLFAAVFAQLMRTRPQRQRKFIYSMFACVTFMSLFVAWSRLGNMDVGRLPGPFGTQNPGWYLLGFGLPAALFLMQKTGEVDLWGALRMSCAAALLGAIFLSGQVYVSLAFALGLGVYLLFANSLVKLVFFAVLGTLVLTVLYLSVDGYFLERLSTSAIARLPWRETSDYYNHWIGGLNVGLTNMLVGVGPNNYDLHCSYLVEQGLESILQFSELSERDGCRSHPHQRYIQVFAETGIIGLILFTSMALVLLRSALIDWKAKKSRAYFAAAPLALLTVNFWPLSNYSEAFGQFMNIYYWFGVGFALSMLEGPVIKKT